MPSVHIEPTNTGSKMKITDVKVFRTATPVHKTAGTNWLFVRIDTDAGISIRAEIAAHEFDDVSVDNNSTNKNVVSVGDMIGATGRISIAKSF